MGIFDKYFNRDKTEPKKEESKAKPTDTTPDMTDNPLAQNVVELKGICQDYKDGKKILHILKDLDFISEKEEGRGSFKVILGPSGCGKSTVLRYIAGLQDPTGGQIIINGEEKNDSHQAGMVFQKYSSFPWRSVLKNVYYGLEIKNTLFHRVINKLKPEDKRREIISKKQMKAKAMEMIETVGLKGHKKKYAQYPTLSGGQLQRVAIARSLLATPDILLMDEPFGALDFPTREKMQDMLVEIWEKFQNTVILVTHDIPEAVYLADDIYILSHAPSNIVHHIKVSDHLPYERKGIKRDPKFNELVIKVKDLMTQVDKEKPNSENKS